MGDATDFGDLSAAAGWQSSGASSTRGVMAGQYASPGANTNVIEYVTIASTGNAADFGDMTVLLVGAGGLTDVHGGLG